jgi:geranylgeranyl pyrophosphate synthase
MLANDFGMDIRDFEANKLLYYTLGACEVIHNSSLIMDDMEDGSLKRRGDDCIHIKYGQDIAVNTGSLLNFICLARLRQFVDMKSPLYSQLLDDIIVEISNMHFGQAWDIDWHRGNHMPTEQNYYQVSLEELSSRMQYHNH